MDLEWRRRRTAAELASRRHLEEVAHLNRSAAVGVLSASLGHELNQPLGAVLSNAEAAQVLGIKPSAAVNRYVRALRRLKEVFEGMPGGIEGIWG